MKHLVPPNLVLAFSEDGTLCVFESPATAVREFEGVDAESGVVRFYDRQGQYLEPVFSKPNKYGKLFGLFAWSVSGTYALTANPNANEDPIAVALFETAVLEPNPWFASLEALKAELVLNGAAVEFNPASEASGT